MNRRDVIEIGKNFNIKPNKMLGQNFLIDNNIITKIINALNINKESMVLEIGPGLGALTGFLIEKAKHVTVVEIDSGIYNYLSHKFGDYSNISIVHGDILKEHPNNNFNIIVSNLPYYCASEIIFMLAKEYKAEDIFITIQKELAMRIMSRAGEKNYGALTVNAGLYFDAEILFNIGGGAFYPKPEVSSAFVRLKRKRIALNCREISLFHSIVKSAFWGRRKTIATSLRDSPHLDLSRDKVDAVLKNAGIDLRSRGEDLSIDDYIKIVRTLLELTSL